MNRDEPTSGALFLKLPIEIQLQIFHHAQNPNLSHLCRKLWHSMPHFPSYCKTIGLAAFSSNCELPERFLNDLVHQRIHRINTRLIPQHLGLNEDQRALQRRACVEWLSLGHLRKLRHWRLLEGAEDLVRNMGNSWTGENATSLTEFLSSQEDAELSFDTNELQSTSFGIPWLSWGDDSVNPWYTNLKWGDSTLVLLVTPRDLQITNCVSGGINLLPFSIDRQITPDLFRMVAKFDRRALELLENLAVSTIRWWKSSIDMRVIDDDLHGPQERKLVSTCIRQILDYTQDADLQLTHAPERLIKDCALLLLRFDATIPTKKAERVEWSSRRSAAGYIAYKKRYQTLPLEELQMLDSIVHPVPIKLSHYKYVIRQQNLPALKLLLYFNWPVYNPSGRQLKKIFRRQLKQHLIDIGQPLTQRASIEALFERAETIDQPEWQKMWETIEEACQEDDFVLQKEKEVHEAERAG